MIGSSEFYIVLDETCFFVDETFVRIRPEGFVHDIIVKLSGKMKILNY